MLSPLFRTAALIVLCAQFLPAKESVIDKFDATNKTVNDLQTILSEEITKGATSVKFSTGQWIWHDLTKLNLKSKADEDLAILQLKIDLATLSKEVKKWIDEHDVKAVQINLHQNQSAGVFFKIERLLIKHKIPYALVVGGRAKQGDLFLYESDGKARVISPK